MRFHGRTSPDSSDILLLYSIGVRVEADIPSLVTRRFDSMTVGTAHFTLVDFDLESLESYPAPNCFCDIEAFDCWVDVIELKCGYSIFSTIDARILREVCVYELSQLLASEPCTIVLRLCAWSRRLLRLGRGQIR